MHISIDAIGITKQCSTEAKYWAGLSEVGLLTQQIGSSWMAFYEPIFNPIWSGEVENEEKKLLLNKVGIV